MPSFEGVAVLLGVLFLFGWLLEAPWIPTPLRVVAIVALTWATPISPVLFSKLYKNEKKK